MKITISKKKPEHKIAWWCMGFGLGLFVVPIISSFLPNIRWGEVNVIPSLLLPLILLTLITGIIAYRKGERSYILWIGLVPAILFSLLLIAEFTIME